MIGWRMAIKGRQGWAMSKDFPTLEDAVISLEAWRNAAFGDLGGITPHGLFCIVIEPFDTGGLAGGQ